MGSLRCASIETRRKDAAYGKAHLLSRLETERYLEIANKVVGFVKRMDVHDVARENYRFSPMKDKQGKPIQSRSTTDLAELGGIVRSQLLLACGIPVVPIAPNTARKFVTGGLKKGKQKEQVSDFLRQRGLRFSNWDEMDAFVIAYCFYGQVNDVRSRFLPQPEFDFGGFGPG
jgi:Holliday junction resolvasome RuvABC endonuclease subunit